MAKTRSPNCPQISFEEAAERARRVYRTEYVHPADKSVIASHLGYSSISGASLSMLGALRQYGLIESVGTQLKISDDAVAYFELPMDSLDRQEALKRMVLRPGLFQELYESYGSRPPSLSNLKHSLLKKGFLPKTAEDVLKVYNENIELLAKEAQDQITRTKTPEVRMLDGQTEPLMALSQDIPYTGPLVQPTKASISTPVGKDENGRPVFAHISFDADIRKSFISGLKKYLDYLESTLSD